MHAESDIPCPRCGGQVGWIFGLSGKGRPYVTHQMTRNVCYIDPTDARLVVWILNNPDWD